MKMEERKIELLKDIGYWYNAQFTIGDKVYCEDEYNVPYIYNSVDEALKDWLDTLEESNINCLGDNCELLWCKEEIELIKNL